MAEELDVNYVVALLESPDTIARRRGLRSFGNMGRAAYALVDRASFGATDPSPMARIAFMDGILSCSDRLNAEQARLVVELADDENELVRSQVIAYLGAAPIDVIALAIALMPVPRRDLFQRWFGLLVAKPEEAQTRFDQAMHDQPIRAAFGFAAVQRLARSGSLPSTFDYSGDDWLAQSVASNANRLARGAARQVAKRAAS